MRKVVETFLRHHFVLFPIAAIVSSHQVLSNLKILYETVPTQSQINIIATTYGILINQLFSVTLHNYIVIASYNKTGIPIKNHAFLQLMRV